MTSTTTPLLNILKVLKVSIFLIKLLPEDWLRKEFEKNLSPEEKAQLKALGGLEALMKTLKERLEEQKKTSCRGE